MPNDTRQDRAKLYSRTMATRSYLFGHTHDLDDPAAPIFCDGTVQEVPRGVRLAYLDTSCESCVSRVHLVHGDGEAPNLLVIGHERQCPWYWDMLAGIERRPELDRLAGFAVTGVRA